MSDEAQKILALYRTTANIIGAALHSALIGEAGCAHGTYRWSGPTLNKEILRIFLFAAFRLQSSKIGRANSVSAALAKRKNRQSADIYCPRFAYCYRNHLLILLYWLEMKTYLIRTEGEPELEKMPSATVPG
jgi:hypothetical protein